MTHIRTTVSAESLPLSRYLIKTCRSILVMSGLFIYCAILLIPLALNVIISHDLSMAFTDECSEYCSICGCAPERSASRTCCCWRNKLHNRPVEKKRVIDDCFKHIQIPPSVAGIGTLSCNSGKFIHEEDGNPIECLVAFSTFETVPALAMMKCRTIRLDYTDWKTEPPDPPPETIHLS